MYGWLVKLQSLANWVKRQLFGNDSDAEKNWKPKEKSVAEDEMAR